MWPKYEKTKLFFFGAVHGFIILGYFLAIQFLSIASAVLLLYSSSVWMILFSALILKEKIKKIDILIILIAVIGLIFVVSPQNLFLRESLIGSIAGLLAGIGMAWVYVISKTFKKYDKISLTFWQNVIAIPFLLPLLFIDFPKFTYLDLGIVLILGIFLTAIPFVFLFKGLEKVKGKAAGIFILLEIIFPVVFAFLFFREVPTVLVWIGGGLIILASYLMLRFK